MGQVWQATDTQLGREVALKILPDAFAADPDRLARFQREAQVLASLNHPGIAAIYGIEKSDDRPRGWCRSWSRARRSPTGPAGGDGWPTDRDTRFLIVTGEVGLSHEA